MGKGKGGFPEKETLGLLFAHGFEYTVEAVGLKSLDCRVCEMVFVLWV